MLAAVFFALRFVHLRADFPNHSPWVDWAKYTDEGWYGDAAIRYHLRGHWNVPGDFNPAAALPVWPILEGLLFAFTGVGIVPARALTVVVTVAIAVVVYLLLRHRPPTQNGIVDALAPAVGVLVLAVNPFLYVFGRMAVLEPLLVLLSLLAMLVAWAPLTPRFGWLRAGLIGLLLVLMLGTKTTAVCLFPAIGWMLWYGERRSLRRFLLSSATALVTAGVLATTYLAGLRHAHYLEDFRYLFTANQYTHITHETFWPVLRDTLHDVAWTGPAFCWIALALVVASFLFRRLWRDALFVACLLWIGGYFAFLAYHANLQPRYYMVLAVPIIVLAVRAAEELCCEWKALTIPITLVFAVVIALQARETLHYMLHPQYTFADAAEKVKGVVLADEHHSHIVLSISGSDLTLMTGLPSICDDFGTLDLSKRIARYHPGWFVAWNYVEDDKMDALGHFYRLTRVAAFPAMDDPDRNLLVVYRLDAKLDGKPDAKPTNQ